MRRITSISRHRIKNKCVLFGKSIDINVNVNYNMLNKRQREKDGSMPTTVKLKDIAAAAQCSVNTVSRALRNCADIGDKTKERIKLLAEQMGYIPDNIAGYLRNGKTNLIGVVVSSTTNPYFTISLNILLKQLRDHEFLPLITVSRSDLLDLDLLADIVRSRICGIISFSDVSDEVINYCTYGNIPLLLVGVKKENENVSTVCADDYMSGYLVGKEFVKSGAKRPCYINTNISIGNTTRRNGFLDAISQSGATCDEYYCSYADRIDEEAELREKLLENKNDFIFCYNDEIASVISELLEKTDYADYTVFGVDGVWRYLPICRRINSVGGNFENIIKCGIDVLINEMRSGETAVFTKVFPVEIIRA